MGIRYFLQALYLVYKGICPRTRAHARRKTPDSYTRDEVLALPRGSGPLLGIALRHADEEIAALAAERIDNEQALYILAIYQEAQLLARMTAVRRLRHKPDILVEIAIRDDDAALARYASHLVESPAHVVMLSSSKYESVRMVGLMKERNPKRLESYLKDPSEPIRERAGRLLRHRLAN